MNFASVRIASLLIVAAALLCAPIAATAQLENSLWYFGYRAGLDFRGGSAVGTPGFDHQSEGTATLCDHRTGRMLMHTDGDTVWNRNGRVMPGGAGIASPAIISSTQGATIIPMPGDSTKFYIVSIDAGEYNGGTSVATWSIVDMELDGGLGAVTTSHRFLHGNVTEKIAVVKHCNGRGFWVIMHELQSTRFIVYYLSKSGFEGPATYDLGTPHIGWPEAAIGGMKFNQAGDRLAVAIFRAPAIDLIDFDRRTGTLSNAIRIDIAPEDSVVYDICFSPDGTKLYSSGEQARYIAQHDLTRGSRAAIIASRTVLHRNTFRLVSYGHTGQMQVGPDGRIYAAIRDESELSVITDPNRAGVACDYRHRAVSLGAPYAKLGMPNITHGMYDPTRETCRPPRALFRSSEIEICAGDTIEITDESYDNPTAWQWTIPGGVKAGDDPGSPYGRHPGFVRFPDAGVFRVMLVAANDNGTDTFSLDVTVNPRPAIEAGPDRTICIGDAVQLDLAAVEAASIRWTPALGLSCANCPAPVAAPAVTTTYHIVATSAAGCVTTDSVTIIVEPFPAVDAGPDTSICVGESVELAGRGGTELTWSPATGLSCVTCATPVATPLVSTTYTLVTSNNGRCVSIDSMRITVSEKPVAEAGEDARICLGESATLRASGGTRYLWSPAESLSCVECAEPSAYPTQTTTYTVRVFNALGCASTDSVTVVVDPAPRLVHANLGPDIGIYPGTELELPVELEEPLDQAFVSVLEIEVTYDPTIMRLERAFLDSTLVEGWAILPISQDPSRGEFVARLFATDGSWLEGTGLLARLRFATFINHGDSSIARLEVRLPGKECTRVETRPAMVRLDSVCGLSQRLLDATGESYALRQNSPNPFNPTTTIEFSLGLDAPTRVEILDLGGRSVAVLADRPMAAGRHVLEWDAAAHPSGLYYCLIISGHWSETIVMTLAK